MPEYKTTIRFERHFTITARNAAEANAKLEELVRDTEFGGNVENTDLYPNTFEDEPVNCPACEGNGDINGDVCPKCHGMCTVPFTGEEVKP